MAEQDNFTTSIEMVLGRKLTDAEAAGVDPSKSAAENARAIRGQSTDPFERAENVESKTADTLPEKSTLAKPAAKPAQPAARAPSAYERSLPKTEAPAKTDLELLRAEYVESGRTVPSTAELQKILDARNPKPAAKAEAEAPATSTPPAAPLADLSVFVSERSSGTESKPAQLPSFGFTPVSARDKGYKDVTVPQATDAKYNTPITIRDGETGDVVLDENGQPKTMTPAAAIQAYAEMQAREINQKYAEYRKEADQARAGALWAEVIRGVAALAAGAYGMRHGVDMSGVKFDPIDWIARQEAARRGHETAVASTKDKYDALSKAAAASEAADKAVFQQDMARVQALTAQNQDAIQQANSENAAREANARLKFEGYRLAAEMDKWDKQLKATLARKSPDQSKAITQAFKGMNDNLNAAGAAEAKGDYDEAATLKNTAHRWADKLTELTELPYNAAESWKTKTESHLGGLYTTGGDLRSAEDISQRLPGGVMTDETLSDLVDQYMEDPRYKNLPREQIEDAVKRKYGQ